MSAYILRRLLIMVPTLWGVTIVSFCIMQLAPGDPLLAKAGGGAAGRTAQTREAYLIQKRDLKLDKPLLLNFNFFRDYTQPVRLAAYYMARTDAEIAAELAAEAGDDGRGDAGTGRQGDKETRRQGDKENAAASPLAPRPSPLAPRSLTFLRGLGIPDFERRLADPQQYSGLAQAIQSYVQVFCENSPCGAGAAVAILRSPTADRRQKIGAVRCLANMVPDPFVYTYSRRPAAAETPQVECTWRSGGSGRSRAFRRFRPAAGPHSKRNWHALAAEPSWGKLMEGVGAVPSRRRPVLRRELLGDSPLREKVVAAMGLRQVAGTPLAADVARDARPQLVQSGGRELAGLVRRPPAQFQPGAGAEAWRVVADTQYAHMVCPAGHVPTSAARR